MSTPKNNEPLSIPLSVLVAAARNVVRRRRTKESRWADPDIDALADVLAAIDYDAADIKIDHDWTLLETVHAKDSVIKYSQCSKCSAFKRAALYAGLESTRLCGKGEDLDPGASCRPEVNEREPLPGVADTDTYATMTRMDELDRYAKNHNEIERKRDAYRRHVVWIEDELERLFLRIEGFTSVETIQRAFRSTMRKISEHDEPGAKAK